MLGVFIWDGTEKSFWRRDQRLRPGVLHLWRENHAHSSQGLSISKRSPEEVQRMMSEANSHLEYFLAVYRRQIVAGRYFPTGIQTAPSRRDTQEWWSWLVNLEC